MLNISPGFPTRNLQNKPMSICWLCTESGLTQRRCDYILLGRQNGKMVGGHRDGKKRRREEADQNQVQDFKDNLGPSPVIDRPVPIGKMVHTDLTKYLGSYSP